MFLLLRNRAGVGEPTGEPTVGSGGLEGRGGGSTTGVANVAWNAEALGSVVLEVADVEAGCCGIGWVMGSEESCVRT